MDARTKKLRGDARYLDPVLHIGKQGLSEGVLAQIVSELKRVQLIKLRVLPAALPDEPSKQDRKELATRLAQATGAQVINIVGNTIVLYKKT